MHRLVWVFVASCLCLQASIAGAQQAAPTTDDSTELAKKLANPISDLVSVPFQFNWAQNVGPYELTQFVLNVQPVIPFTLNEDWNMIVRVIAPFVGQPPLFPIFLLSVEAALVHGRRRTCVRPAVNAGSEHRIW